MNKISKNKIKEQIRKEMDQTKYKMLLLAGRI